MDHIQFYEAFLKSVWIEDIGGAGQLFSLYNPDKPVPVTLGGKTLWLPLKDVLREGKKEDRVVFHPASENITRAESDVIKQARDLVQLRVAFVISGLAENMARVAATNSLHKGLGKAGKYLLKVPEFDEKTYLEVDKLIKRQTPDPDRRIVSINLRQGSKTKDDGVIRSTLVSFPLMDELENPDSLEVFGKNLPSKKAKERIRCLFEVILGDKETREGYSYGSRNMEAPYLHSLLSAYANLLKRLNEIVETHAKLLGPEDTAALTTSLDWLPGLEELGRYRSAVPPQAGNEGAIKVVDAERNRPSGTEVARSVLAPVADRGSESTLPWEDEPAPAARVTRDAPAPARGRQAEPEQSGSLRDYLARQNGGGRQAETNRFGRDTDSRRVSGGGITLSRNSGNNFGSGLRASNRRSF